MSAKEKKIAMTLSVLVVIALGILVAVSIERWNPLEQQYLAEEEVDTSKEVFLEGENVDITPEKVKVERTSPAKEKKKEKIKNREALNILLLGTDERGNEPSRTDTIILARISKDWEEVNLVSIPRDSKVRIPRKGTTKINGAHAYGGVNLTIQTIEGLMGIPIDYYAKVNFEGFKELVNIVGGVEVTVPHTMSYKDITLHKGTRVLSPEELLTFVRFRMDKDGDKGRIKRQQDVAIKMMKEIMHPSNALDLPDILKTIMKNVKTDLTIGEMLAFSDVLKNAENTKITQHTLKTTSSKENGIWYENIDEKDLYNIIALFEGDERAAIGPPVKYTVDDMLDKQDIEEKRNSLSDRKKPSLNNAQRSIPAHKRELKELPPIPKQNKTPSTSEFSTPR